MSIDGHGRRADLNVGDRWGRLSCTREGAEDYVVNEWEKRKDWAYVVLRCDCGREVKVWKHEWAGRRKMMDCGCGLHVQDGAVKVLCITLRVRTVKLLQEYARKHAIKTSKAINDLVLKGVDGGEVENGKG